MTRALLLLFLLSGCGISPVMTCSTRSNGECTCGPFTGESGAVNTCSVNSYFNDICCVTPDFPSGASSKCSCESYGCTETTSLCTCAKAPGYTTQSSCYRSWTTCCLKKTTNVCACANGATCDADETPVSSCGTSMFQCRDSTNQVYTCGDPLG